MAATRTNNSGMSDADFFGRSPAPEINRASALADAVSKVAAGVRTIIHGEGRVGQMKIACARIEYAIVVGNEEDAMSEIAAHFPGLELTGELARGVERENAHPGLVEKLEEFRGHLKAAMKSAYGN